jgi:hypothetical protein
VLRGRRIGRPRSGRPGRRRGGVEVSDDPRRPAQLGRHRRQRPRGDALGPALAPPRGQLVEVRGVAALAVVGLRQQHLQLDGVVRAVRTDEAQPRALLLRHPAQDLAHVVRDRPLVEGVAVRGAPHGGASEHALVLVRLAAALHRQRRQQLGPGRVGQQGRREGVPALGEAEPCVQDRGAAADEALASLGVQHGQRAAGVLEDVQRGPVPGEPPRLGVVHRRRPGRELEHWPQVTPEGVLQVVHVVLRALAARGCSRTA